MNPKYFGDSYDIVKRFFCAELRGAGYSVMAVPMFTGEWGDQKQIFLRFIGAALQPDSHGSDRTALFIDPDTGVGARASGRHITVENLTQLAQKHSLVFAFDQSFSRGGDPRSAMERKLTEIRDRACHGMYYDSHARFLFVTTSATPLEQFRERCVTLGMPSGRFISIPP